MGAGRVGERPALQLVAVQDGNSRAGAGSVQPFGLSALFRCGPWRAQRGRHAGEAPREEGPQRLRTARSDDPGAERPGGRRPGRGRGPHVGQPGVDRGKGRPVDGGILAHERRLVRPVQGATAQPWWQLPRGQARGGHGRARAGELDDVPAGGVAEATGGPLEDDGQTVGHERTRVTAPHEHGGVVSPAVALQVQGTQDLQDLDTLLAQPPVVEHGRRAREGGGGEEGLHGGVPAGPFLPCTRHG